MYLDEIIYMEDEIIYMEAKLQCSALYRKLFFVLQMVWQFLHGAATRRNPKRVMVDSPTPDDF